VVASPAADAATLSIACGDTSALIAAIKATNSAGSGTISLCASTYTLTAPYSGSDGLPQITGIVSITTASGKAAIARSTSSMTPDFRIFDVASSGSLGLRSLTISHGSVTGKGAAIYNGGGSVLIDGSTLSRNHASGAGGAVYNSGGTVQVLASTLSGNVANGSGGGGVYSSGGTLTVKNSKLSSNATAGSGGAIDNNDLSSATVTNSTIAGNHANGGATAGGGGGIWNMGPLQVSGSTLDANVAAHGSGGAILTQEHLYLSDSTVVANTAKVAGGGIDSTLSGPSQLVTASTLAHNTAPTGANIDATGTASGASPIAITQTIVADPTSGTDCSTSAASSTAVSDAGYNLESATDCGFTQSTDKQNADPMLDSLRLNGGRTQTEALETGSPAIDRGPATCSSPDQRGMARPEGAACDIGAFEANMSITIGLPGLSTRYDAPPSITLKAASLNATAIKSLSCTVNGTAAPLTGESGLRTTAVAATLVPAASVLQQGPNNVVVCRGGDSEGFDGVSAPASFWFDTQPPTVSLPVANAPASTGWFNVSTGAPNVTANCNDPGPSSGLLCEEFPGVLTSCTAASNPSGPAACSFQPFPLSDGGDQTIAVSAADGAGNTGGASAAFNVDLTPPTVTCTTAPTFILNNPQAFVSASVSDATSGPTSSSVEQQLLDNEVGTFTQSLTGADVAGNTTTTDCLYTVTYSLLGFASPAASAVVTPGQAVNVAFTLGDANGQLLDPVAQNLADSGQLQALFVGVGAPAGVTYDATTHHFIATLTVPTNASNGTVDLVVQDAVSSGPPLVLGSEQLTVNG
jgi:hypothetical protein